MVDSQRHLILIRDRVTKIRLAEKLLEDMLRPRPEVAVEVEILATDRMSSLGYGLTMQTAFPLTSLAQHVTWSQFPATFMKAKLWSMGMTNANLFANLTKSTAATLLSS